MELKESRIIVGVDPGIHGSIVGLLKNDGSDKYKLLFIMDVEYDKDEQIISYNSMISNCIGKGNLLKLLNNRYVGSKYDVFTIVEKVHSLPRDSKQSAFTFGMLFGQIRMMLYLIFPPHNIEKLISIQKWKSIMNIKKKNEAKNIITDYIDDKDELFEYLLDNNRFDRIEAALIGIAGDIFLSEGGEL